MKKQWLICIFLLSCGSVFSQEPVVREVLENYLESAGENISDETDIQEILEDLEYLRQNPINVNVAEPNEFYRLHVLTELQIANLNAYRMKTGNIFSIYELSAVEGFSPDLLQKIEPFLCFIPESKVAGKKVANDFFIRSTRTFQTDSQPAKYEGSPLRLYTRLKHGSPAIDYGFVAEKDPGEAFARKSNPQGFDYMSAFLNVRLRKSQNRIFLGDYHVRFGQGLVAWQGFSMGKSADATQVARSNEGIRSYSSTDENQFFRGIAGRFKFGRLVLYPFVSSRKLDARIEPIDEKPFFESMQTSGYHRYGSELSGKDALRQLSGGMHLQLAIRQWTVGFTGMYNRFAAELNRSDEPYNQFLPEGKAFAAAGLDWKGTYRNLFVFGEAAMSGNQAGAVLSGLMVKPASNTEIALVYRNIGRNYFSFFGNAFTESSRLNDEHAVYIGCKIFPAARWEIKAYIDLFRYRWIKYTTASPGGGAEAFVQIIYNPSRNTGLNLRFFQEEKELSFKDISQKFNTTQSINKLRFHVSHQFSEQIAMNSRMEFSFYSKATDETGFLLFQDVHVQPSGKSFSLNGRLAYFNTDSYNSRLYAYEPDMLYTFSIPALYNHGFRSFLNFRKNVGRDFTLWLKVAASCYLSPKTEGLTVNPNDKYELKLQIRYRF